VVASLQIPVTSVVDPDPVGLPWEYYLLEERPPGRIGLASSIGEDWKYNRRGGCWSPNTSY